LQFEENDREEKRKKRDKKRGKDDGREKENSSVKLRRSGKRGKKLLRTNTVWEKHWRIQGRTGHRVRGHLGGLVRYH
jgi:hypothetical protein